MTECAPVVVFLYNRPEYSADLIRRVRDAKPARLYLVFDGPSTDPAKPDDVEKCALVRRQWGDLAVGYCARAEVARGHMGCRDRVASGLDWVFERETEAIILEDDLLPNASFFRFCTAALERYRDNDRVMAATGCNFGWNCPTESAYWSQYSHVWGWATWRRAWRFYDVRARAWAALHGPGLLDSLLRNRSREIRAHWARQFEAVASGKLDTWDYQWQLAIWLRDGDVVGPPKNLVSNVGIGPNATHTKDDSALMGRATFEIDLPTRWLPTETPHNCDRWFDETYILPLVRLNGYK